MSFIAYYKYKEQLGNKGTERLTQGQRYISAPTRVRVISARTGGQPHQDKVNEVEKKLQDDGYETQREVKVETPDGSKTKRYIDVQGKKDGETKSFQIGKENKNGTPVSREVKALDDIERATGERPGFVPYNK